MAVAKLVRSARPQAEILICADDDYQTKVNDKLHNTGLIAARAAARAVGGKVAVPVFAERPKGATDFNDLSAAQGPSAVARIVEAALSRPTEQPTVEPRFLLKLPGSAGPLALKGKPCGVYHLVENDDGETSWRWLCSPVEIAARTRDAVGKSHGRLLHVHTLDNAVNKWAMPMEMLGGSGEEYRRELLHLGMTIAPGTRARASLHEYLSTSPEKAVTCVDRVGWHGDTFVLPDAAFAPDGAPELELQSAIEFRLARAGSLRGWQDEVAAPSVGNSRLVFGISLGFAAPLLAPAGEESGGFHIRGETSQGKTVAIDVAGSVAGTNRETWRLTDNGAEGLAAGSCDLLLGLDELRHGRCPGGGGAGLHVGERPGQSEDDPSRCAAIAADLANSRPSQRELGLEAKLGEVGLRARAGQHVRLVELPGDAGAGMGVIETIPYEGMDPRTFVEALRAAAKRHTGHALPIFLRHVVDHAADVRRDVRAARESFIDGNVKAGAAPEVARVCGRFALVAFAGELATRLASCRGPLVRRRAPPLSCSRIGSLPVVARARRNWGPRSGRCGCSSSSTARAASPMRGASRLKRERRCWPRSPTPRRAPSIVRACQAGRRRQLDTPILPEVWRAEVCKGLNADTVAKAMVERGWMAKGEGKNLAKRHRVPGEGENLRLFTVTPAFWRPTMPPSETLQRGVSWSERSEWSEQRSSS